MDFHFTKMNILFFDFQFVKIILLPKSITLMDSFEHSLPSFYLVFHEKVDLLFLLDLELKFLNIFLKASLLEQHVWTCLGFHLTHLYFFSFYLHFLGYF